jgi:hypothetical protein
MQYSSIFVFYDSKSGKGKKAFPRVEDLVGRGSYWWGEGGWGERIWTLEYRPLLDFIWKDQPDSYELRQFQPGTGTSVPELYWSQNQVFRYLSHTSPKSSALYPNVRTMLVWKCSRNSILVGLPGWCDLCFFLGIPYQHFWYVQKLIPAQSGSKFLAFDLDHMNCLTFQNIYLLFY